MPSADITPPSGPHWPPLTHAGGSVTDAQMQADHAAMKAEDAQIQQEHRRLVDDHKQMEQEHSAMLK